MQATPEQQPEKQDKKSDGCCNDTNAVNYIFHSFDFLIGILFCIDAYFVISAANNLPRIVLPIYYFAFGLIIITLVFYAPSFISNSIIFYWTFIGRALTFIFLSAPLISFGSDIDFAAGVISALFGFIYLILALLTIKRCPALSITLPPPIFQRTEPLPGPDNNYRQKPQKKQKWKYKEKERKKQKQRDKNAKKQQKWM